MDNLQTNKKYFIPMEVTPETIKAFSINAEDVQWSRIGNKPTRVIMVPATEEQYYEYMRTSRIRGQANRKTRAK